MSTSPELQVLKNYSTNLETLLKPPERKVVNFLNQKGFIGESVRDDVLNPRSMMRVEDKAGMLVDGIKNAVSRDKTLYYTLVEYFQSNGSYAISPLVNYWLRLLQMCHKQTLVTNQALCKIMNQ